MPIVLPPPSDPFDPLAAQAASVAELTDRVGTVRVERPREPAKPSRPAMAPGTSGDPDPLASAWPDSADPLADSVDASDNAAVVRDPEVGHDPPSVVVGNSPPQPLTDVEIERTPHDPNAGHVEHVNLTSHLERPAPSTDPYAGVSFNPTRTDR
jgi:hypothetical protein